MTIIEKVRQDRENLYIHRDIIRQLLPRKDFGMTGYGVYMAAQLFMNPDTLETCLPVRETARHLKTSKVAILKGICALVRYGLLEHIEGDRYRVGFTPRITEEGEENEVALLR